MLSSTSSSLDSKDLVHFRVFNLDDEIGMRLVDLVVVVVVPLHF